MFSNFLGLMVLTMALSLEAGSICPRVKFFAGRIVTTDDVSSCTFTVGGEGGSTLQGDSIRALSVYGIINYDCGICSSVEASLYTECMDCTFCLHNEYITSCRAIALPLMIATLITLLIIMVIILLAWLTDIPKHLALLVAKTSLARSARKLESRRKSAKKLLDTGLFESTTGESVPVLLPKPTDAAQPSVSSPWPNLYMELSEMVSPDVRPSMFKRRSDNSVEPQASPPRGELPQPPSSRPKPINYNKAAAAAALSLSILTGQVHACDVTAYVSSANQIYRDSGLTELNTGVFFLQTGQSVCLRYSDETLDRIFVSESWIEDTYSPTYRTSNFNLDVETKWNCMGAGYCWDGYCQKNSRHPDWTPRMNGSAIETFGCFQSAAYCSHCTYNKQCVYYKATIKPIGPLYTVSHLTETDWKITLQISRHDGSLEKLTLSSKLVSGGSSVKISLMQPAYSVFHYQESLLTNSEGVSWSVNSNPLGDLSQALIGDLQVGLYDGKQLAYLSTAMDCEPNSCKAQCTLPESGLIRGLKQFKNYTVDTIQFGSDLIVKRPVRMSSGAFITTSKSFGINVIEADCQFKVLATYGCTACKKPSMAYIQSTDIKTNGLVKFTTNCDLDTNVLSCQESPQQIKISGHQQDCNITINNHTLSLHVNYIFEGEVYGLGVVISSGRDTSTTQILGTFFTNPNFLKGLSSMLTVTFLAGFILAAVKAMTRYAAIYAGAKAGREAEEAT